MFGSVLPYYSSYVHLLISVEIDLTCKMLPRIKAFTERKFLYLTVRN